MAKLDGTEPIDPASRESAYAESRWPMAAAVVAAMHVGQRVEVTVGVSVDIHGQRVEREL